MNDQLKRSVTIPIWAVSGLWVAMIGAVGWLYLTVFELKADTKYVMKIEQRLEKIETKLDEVQKELYRTRRYTQKSNITNIPLSNDGYYFIDQAQWEIYKNAGKLDPLDVFDKK